MRWWMNRFTGLVNTHHDSLVTGTELLHRFRARGCVSLSVCVSGRCVSMVGECVEWVWRVDMERQRQRQKQEEG